MNVLPSGWGIYSCEYSMGGKEWSVNFPATSFEDAAERIMAMQSGSILKVIESGPAADLLDSVN